MRLHIITAALPPLLDGIGDYTAMISQELAHAVEVTVHCGAGEPDSIPGVAIERDFDATDPGTLSNLVDSIAGARPDWVLLQYMPFSYGRWGLNLKLPEAMHEMKNRSDATRFALMIHEPFVPVRNVKLAVMTSWQRWQLWRLGRAADLILVSIEPWRNRFQKWFPDRRVRHLPVGSNISPVLTSHRMARERLGISEDRFVIGYFGTWHDSRMVDWVTKAAIKAGERALVLYVGPDRAQVEATLGRIPNISGGPYPADEISRRFAAMDIHLCPFNDGVSTRRGSFMCGLAHGVPTVATKGHNTDSILLNNDGSSFLLTDVSNPDHFCDEVARLQGDVSFSAHLGENARQLYHDHFSWPVICSALKTYMNNATAERRPVRATPLHGRLIEHKGGCE